MMAWADGDDLSPANLNNQGGIVSNVIANGAVGDGTTDDSAAFLASLTSNTYVLVPAGTYKLSNLSVAGLNNIAIVGVGPQSILDFSGVTNGGDGLRFDYSAGSGGPKYITLRDLTIKDSNASSFVKNLVTVRGGPAGQTPSQTAAFVLFDNVNMPTFNNSNGTAIYLDGPSDLCLRAIQQGYQWGAGEGLFITNTAAVNTGVLVADANTFFGKTRGLRIKAVGDLLDSYHFSGNFISNYSNSDATDAIRLEGGTAGISSIVFTANHIEARGAAADCAVTFTGNISAMRWDGNHLSCGASDKQCQYGFRFSNATVRGSSFQNNEFLRVKAGASGGRAFFFDANCTGDSQQPVVIGPHWMNITAPPLVDYESTATDELLKSIHAPGDLNSAGSTVGPLRPYNLPSGTSKPSVKNAYHFNSVGTTTVIDFANGYQGQVIDIVRLDGEASVQTFSHNTTGGKIYTKSSTDVELSQRSTIQFRRGAGGYWYEI